MATIGFFYYFDYLEIEKPSINEKIPAKGKKQKILFVTFDTASLNLHYGPAILNIKAVDYSILRNKTVQSSTVMIDTIPPQITLLSTTNHINQGGTCLTR